MANNVELIEDDEGILSMTLIDEEGDPIECVFNYDGCVQLNLNEDDVTEYSYIVLSKENLSQLFIAIDKADAQYAKTPITT